MNEVIASWILVFYSVSFNADGTEKTNFAIAEQGYETLANCEKAGNDRLAVIDMKEGVNPYFVCVPIGAFKMQEKGLDGGVKKSN